MSEAFLGQIIPVAFNFPPKGWAFCDGQTLAINQNQALFSLLGTMYGGDGRQTFALPNLRGRVPMHVGNGHVQGEAGGQETHTLISTEIGGHAHTVTSSASKDEETTNRPDGAYFSAGGAYGGTADTAMGGTPTSATGGSQAHENRQPSLVLTFVIAFEGVFPSRN